MIKIVHIAKPLAGVGVYIDLLSNHINNREFENYILCNENDDNICIHDSSGKKIELKHIDLEREINLFKDINCLKQIVSLLKEIKPDIIHCHSAKAGIVGRLASFYVNVPCLYTPHAFSFLSAENKIKKYFFEFIEKSFKYSSSKILACSKSEYQRAIKDLKFPKNKVLLWENSIPKNNSIRQLETGIDLPENYICTIGRPSYQKNTDLLIETIYKVKKEMKNIHLVVLGVGLFSPSVEKTKDQIEKFDLTQNVTLVEWVSRAETLSILKGSMLFVSSSRYEGLSYAGIESLMLSKPGILTNVDGNKDLIEDKVNGFLVKENSNIFASKVIKILNDKDLLKKMSLASRKKFETDFDIKKNILKLENIYKCFLSDN